MRAAIVKPHHAGLFSLINNVVTCLPLYDYVCVDWSSGCIYGNAWPALFESNILMPNADYPEWEKIDVITEYPHQALTYKNAGLLYQAESLLGWRARVYTLWNKLKLRKEVTQRAHDFIDATLGWHYAAILVRGNGHAGEQLTNQAQTADAYRRALEEHGTSRVFVMSGDKESLEWFSGFDIISHPGTCRSSTRDCQRHLDTPQTIEDAVQCMVEVIILSCATVLIHPVSNMATAALYMNPGLQSIYLP